MPLGVWCFYLFLQENRHGITLTDGPFLQSRAVPFEINMNDNDSRDMIIQPSVPSVVN